MQSPSIFLRKRLGRARHRLDQLACAWGAGEPKRRAIFMHIPKCAGTTINLFFKSYYGSARSGRVVIVDDRRGKLELREQILRAQDAPFVGGHFGFETLEKIRGDALVFTVLREPHERLRSVYGHLRTQTKGNPVGGRARDMSLRDFLSSDDEAILQWSDNAMARALALSADRAAVAGMAGARLAADAIDHLCKFDHVAFVGSLDQDFDRIAAAVGFSSAGPLTHENATRAKLAAPPLRETVDPFDVEARRLAAPLVRFDLGVYAAARALRAGASNVRAFARPQADLPPAAGVYDVARAAKADSAARRPL
jgi:hypothetical protein